MIWCIGRDEQVDWCPGLTKGDVQDRIKIRRTIETEEEEEEPLADEDEYFKGMNREEIAALKAQWASDQERFHQPDVTYHSYYVRMGRFEADGIMDIGTKKAYWKCSTRKTFLDDAGNPFLGFWFLVQKLGGQLFPLYGWAKLRIGLEGCELAKMSEAEEQRSMNDVPEPYDAPDLDEEMMEESGKQIMGKSVPKTYVTSESEGEPESGSDEEMMEDSGEQRASHGVPATYFPNDLDEESPDVESSGPEEFEEDDGDVVRKFQSLSTRTSS
ncbi:hypothetical protein DL98DRAFT_542307 [Cadophora sp. DSE1049]|nr:hypothetical protein DL98DRAFT_542307 [Cadophora sp. DSE1049]